MHVSIGKKSVVKPLKLVFQMDKARKAVSHSNVTAKTVAIRSMDSYAKQGQFRTVVLQHCTHQKLLYIQLD